MGHRIKLRRKWDLAAAIAAAAIFTLAAAATAQAQTAPTTDKTFCLSHQAECDGDWILERDRSAQRDQIRREASRPSEAPARASKIGPTPDAARRYDDFCLGAPSTCSGNFVLDRQNSAYRRFDRP